MIVRQRSSSAASDHDGDSDGADNRDGERHEDQDSAVSWAVGGVGSGHSDV